MIQAPKTIKPADVYARPVFHVRMAACWRGRRSKPFAESKPARNGRIKGGIRSTGWKLYLSFILCRSIYFNHGMTAIRVKFI